MGSALERAISPARFAAFDRPPSGKVVIVEMDARSVAAIRRWPWSRSNYAKAVDRLRLAGASSIVFDVDFSTPSDNAGDTAFAASLARAEGRVALATFGQSESSTDQRIIDALPIRKFRPHVALASVNIAPDPDGQVRAMLYGTMTDGTPRPSLAAYIAQRSGSAGTEFAIDLSIDPATIPRLSLIDVIEGRFDRSAVRGHDILIGATAIEMGDRYGTPQWGVIPGVVIQAMAAETLLRGVPLTGSALTLFVVGMIATGLIVASRSTGMLVATVGAPLVLIVIAALVAQHWLLITYPLVPPLGMIAVAGMICGLREAAARFRRQRTIDEATGLPNKKAMIAAGEMDASATLVVVQIDNYDSLQAVLGAGPSDDLIVRVSERLALIARDRAVFRTGDRQLAFRLPADHCLDDTLEGLRIVLRQPVEVAGRRADVMASAGVASGTDGVGSLLLDAVIAAEEAVRLGKFWHDGARDGAGRDADISLMGELDDALRTDLIEVYYQPKYSLREDRIASVEALVRWKHPERGFIGPDLFIPMAEKTNRIEAMTLYVLHRVVSDLAIWRIEHPDVTAAVNISAKLLSDTAFNTAVEDILKSSCVPTSSLIFEVTESAAMSDPARAIAALNRYRELGVAVSMDDYGTGQSTLTYIRQLPLSELKIDRSFVQHASRNVNDAVLVRSTIELAHKLGLKVVAEGVEDLECLTFLKACGCDLAQGYLISRPVPISALTEMLSIQMRFAA
ncbi:putative bifunctional diguanylate cyclase/phosphodiesterase [Sphingomonas aliaeris]|uniref:putative bifunctional diguanylate cyclase/phosphodiesterase n=1 Tax=Sphingomonas aliaeris TaxID=2759526 RepID=UPI001CEC50C8|nr:EAL domain-containing protein [Sphingomonas aliaeris]